MTKMMVAFSCAYMINVNMREEEHIPSRRRKCSQMYIILLMYMRVCIFVEI